MGSGLVLTVCIVFVQKQSQTHLVHLVTLGKRKRLSHKPPQTLADNIVETLNVARLPCTFARRFVLRVRQHLLVRLPEVAVKRRALVALRHPLPQKGAGRFAAVP